MMTNKKLIGIATTTILAFLKFILFALFIYSGIYLFTPGPSADDYMCAAFSCIWVGILAFIF